MDVKLAGLSALVIVLVIVAGALGVMYSSLASKYSSLKSSYSSLKGSYSSLNTSYTSLSASYSSLKGEYSSLQNMYSALESMYKNQQADVVLAAAMSHWNDIAIESPSLVAPQYLSNATLHWIGGPLSGVYTGISAINATWNKFFNMYETVYWYTIVPPTVTPVSPGVYNVTGYVQFLVAPTAAPINVLVLNVTEVLTYVNTSSGYLIENEVWKVKPIPLTDVIAGYPGQEQLAESAVLADAMSHWNDIAIESPSLVIMQYAPDATLDWVGGPLSGVYTGIPAINATWNKFFNMYETVYWYTIVPPTVTMISPVEYNVTGYAQFFVAPTAAPLDIFVLNVTEVLTYTYNSSAASFQITHEVWKVKPIPLTDVIAGYPGQEQLIEGTVLAAAMSHWNEIAIESAPLVIAEYAPNATLDWVGGPLSGVYTGISAINATWNKFFNMYETVYWYTIIPPTVTMISPTEYNVTGYAQFFVAPTAVPIHPLVLNVTEILTYVYNESAAQFQITHEVWKVKPLSLSDVIAGYPPQTYIEEQMALAQAYAHWNDIAIENASLIITEYAPNATLHWIGGPLSGNYTGISTINATWTKFDNMYEYVVWYALVPPTVQVKGDMAMVKAPLQFVVFPYPTASNPHPVELVLNVTEILYYNYNATAMQWQIVNEYWIVHPLSISDVAPGYSPGQYQG
ncbi:hypothetical protein ASAC_1344 [Acidilobus saccharovorans 345-15]|uniref:Uncharacterized protein n=1 Tax=Acidilobus saccharovorans (strain DSM 16705 / JCM 18335 / VKM B-2471 / 345-15) TaxID=666510 RepID=D9Q361_ACIS3|nr:hypothetical protein [Acidilobus saccharovorans]ADL19749.1 hypothetical protein ASAC_1344 [Acidilobus saccharovorans 345-15]